jgi:hypothetical protein
MAICIFYKIVNGFIAKEMQVASKLVECLFIAVKTIK